MAGWDATIGAGIGLAGSLIGGGKSSSAAQDAAQKQQQTDTMMAVWQNDANRQNAEYTNQQNLGNYVTQNQVNRGNADYANTQNIQNTNWLNQLNQDNSAWANNLNKENASWVNQNNADITQANQGLQDYVTAQNRPDQVGAGGGTVKWTVGPDGKPVQTSSLGAASQGLYDQAQGVQSNMLGGLEGGFGVDNSVMQAIRGLQNPGLQQSEDAANARLAAMGLSTGSGTAWNNAQTELNKTRTNADLQAILGGNTAWLQSQANMRNNLGSAGQTASQQITDFRNSMPDFYKEQAAQQNQQNGIANVNAVNSSMPGYRQSDVTLPGFNMTSFPNTGNIGMNATNAGNATGQAVGNSWASGAAGVGELAGSLWNAWQQPNSEYQAMLNGTLRG
jgi:hypothetical protein